MHLLLEIFPLNESADNILILANASKPFKSSFGLPGSAKPNFCAFCKTLSNV